MTATADMEALIARMVGPLVAEVTHLRRELDDLRAGGSLTATRGTYTPQYRGADTAGATTYTTQLGRYMRLGPLVLAFGQLAWSAATGTGNAQIGLPFAAANLNYPVLLRLTGVTYAGDSPQGVIAIGNDYFTIEGVTSNAAPTTTAIEPAGGVTFAALYLTS